MCLFVDAVLKLKCMLIDSILGPVCVFMGDYWEGMGSVYGSEYLWGVVGWRPTNHESRGKESNHKSKE